jgi:hypothetical protein
MTTMIDTFVERRWPQSLTEADMQGLLALTENCLRIHRVKWCGSVLSSDQRELFCHFQGPDAESVRIASRQAGGPPAHVWPCLVEDAPGITDGDLVRTNVIVGHSFEAQSGFGERELNEVVDMGCFKLHRVRRLRSYLSLDRLRMFSLYEAPDAESVRIAQRQAGLPPDRVWAGTRLAP